MPRNAEPWTATWILRSQFAPGSETVKDKRVYRAAGLAEFIPLGDRVGVKPGLTPALKDQNGIPVGNVRLGICRSCQAVAAIDRTTAPPVGGREPPLHKCPVCGALEMPATMLRAAVLLLLHDDCDGTFEWVPRLRPHVTVSAAPTSRWRAPT